ncbi:MAG: SHOCT domain-containing protein [Longimicrobiales bacterium]|nr:SHOCT domain-containing protein [Longimicrobiales bacterium]
MTAVLSAALQMSDSWHDGGMFMGMHWVWWSIWLLTIAFLLWGFWRVFADRSGTHRRAQRQETAEEALRKRFANGEINEEEFARRLRILWDTPSESR